jgi:hypothetical protein
MLHVHAPWVTKLRKNYEEDGTILVSPTCYNGKGSPNR